MCGIAGILSMADTNLEQNIEKMVEAMAHRGPDDSGRNIFLNQRFSLALGHRRLSIIDLSYAGHQPMSNDDGSIWIVYNGEVYNFKDIRKELESKGKRFRSQTDTEVVLKAYEEWGYDCLKKFRGMFAFAIWDRKRNHIFLARDRMGIKPLYYYSDSSKFIFASEVKAILVSGLINKILSIEGLYSYLQFGGVQEPFTLVQNIFSLSPGHYLIHNGEDYHIQKYWDILDIHNQFRNQNLIKCVEHTRSLLEEAVKIHLVSDVPIGAFLSGGIDSSSVVALMRKVSNGVIKTVSIVFPQEKKFDESIYSRMIAKKFETEHIEIKLIEKELLNHLPDALKSMDQPTFDGINTYFVSKYTRQAGLTVALSGLGGDELFGGYPSFFRVPKIEKIVKIYNSLPHFLKQTGLTIFKGMLGENDQSRKILSLLSNNTKQDKIYFLLRSLFTESEISKLMKYGHVENFKEYPEIDDVFNKVSYLEMTNYMLNILLRDTDFMSMVSSLEVRVPFLDHRVVEYVLSLPGRIKLNSKIPKSLLIGSLPTTLPKSIIYRRKMGFTFPFAVWLKRELKKELEDVLLESNSNSSLGEILEVEEVRHVLTNFFEGKTSWHRPWALYVVKKWYERNLR